MHDARDGQQVVRDVVRVKLRRHLEPRQVRLQQAHHLVGKRAAASRAACVLSQGLPTTRPDLGQCGTHRHHCIQTELKKARKRHYVLHGKQGEHHGVCNAQLIFMRGQNGAQVKQCMSIRQMDKKPDSTPTVLAALSAGVHREIDGRSMRTSETTAFRWASRRAWGMSRCSMGRRPVVTGSAGSLKSLIVRAMVIRG